MTVPVSCRVYLGGMTLAVPGSTGFVALAQRAVIGMTVSPVDGTTNAKMQIRSCLSASTSCRTRPERSHSCAFEANPKRHCRGQARPTGFCRPNCRVMPPLPNAMV
jgi:hypothetical protein